MRIEKANDNTTYSNENVVLPLPPLGDNVKMEMEVYVRFMRHLRYVSNSRVEIKILSAIQYVADMLDMQDSEVAKMLVDQGLRASRMAFPALYLEHADFSFLRGFEALQESNKPLLALYEFWSKTGENRFAAYERSYPILSAEEFLTTI